MLEAKAALERKKSVATDFFSLETFYELKKFRVIYMQIYTLYSPYYVIFSESSQYITVTIF